METIRELAGRRMRYYWDEQFEEWYFCIADIVEILTESTDVKQYIKRLRQRDPELDSVWGTICTPHQFISSDRKKHASNCTTMEGILRIIQSIPSKKAEPVKQWLATVGAERINQVQDPERSIEQAIQDYRRLGYSEEWINRRIKTIEIRKGLTDEWKRGGVTKEIDFAFLTDLMSRTWSGLSTKEYKNLKGLKKESLRDNMTNMELLLNALAEESATQLSMEKNPEGLRANAEVAAEGAQVAKEARDAFEKRVGHSVISSKKAIDNVIPADELPFEKDTQNIKEEHF